MQKGPGAFSKLNVPLGGQSRDDRGLKVAGEVVGRIFVGQRSVRCAFVRQATLSFVASFPYHPTLPTKPMAAATTQLTPEGGCALEPTT